MEFVEVREYAPGDEVRTIDWNVTARMGTPYVKKFVEERDLTLLLVVDVSGSQQFGSQYLLKRDYAAELAAVLAFSAVANHDRVGAVLFTDRIEGYMPPARGRDHALRIVRDLLAREPQGRGTDLAGALRFAQRVLRRARDRGRHLRLPGRGLREGPRHPARAATTWSRSTSRTRARRDVPAAGLVAFTDPETGAAWSSTRRGPRCAAACGPRASTSRRRSSDDTQWMRWRSRRGVVRPAAARASSRRGSGAGDVRASPRGRCLRRTPPPRPRRRRHRVSVTCQRRQQEPR